MNVFDVMLRMLSFHIFRAGIHFQMIVAHQSVPVCILFLSFYLWICVSCRRYMSHSDSVMMLTIGKAMIMFSITGYLLSSHEYSIYFEVIMDDVRV